VDIGRRPVGIWPAVTLRYFETMGMAIVKGRNLAETDSETAPLVVVVSDGLARRLWPADNPIGKRLLVGRQDGFAEVVGIVPDVKNAGLAAEALPAMYTPYAQRPWPSMALVVRSASADPLMLVNELRASIATVDRDQPVTQIETMDAALSDSVATERLITAVLIVFAAIALAMAAAGLYGVIAYTVEQRTREIGVRVALGAEPRGILALIGSYGGRLVGAGILIGVAVALIAARALRGIIAGIPAPDPLTVIAVIIVFLVAAVLACVVPARRALRVDPMVALRVE
jgi:putative ABC transport system permease protein